MLEREKVIEQMKIAEEDFEEALACYRVGAIDRPFEAGNVAVLERCALPSLMANADGRVERTSAACCAPLCDPCAVVAAIFEEVETLASRKDLCETLAIGPAKARAATHLATERLIKEARQHLQSKAKLAIPQTLLLPTDVPLFLIERIPSRSTLSFSHLLAELDEEFVEGILQFAFVDPARERVEEGFRDLIEESISERADERIAVRGVGVDERYEGAAGCRCANGLIWLS